MPAIGGGPDEPYGSWGAYVRATVVMGVVWLVYTGVFAAAITAWLRYGARRRTGAMAAKCRVLMLSAVPLVLPMLVLLPLQVLVRARDQIVPMGTFPSDPAWEQLWVVGFKVLGSLRWLLVPLAVWGWIVSRAWIGLTRTESWRRSGCCTQCGYALAGGDGGCPECGEGKR
jgi:hypothetical protein